MAAPKAEAGAIVKATTDIVAQMAEKAGLDRAQYMSTLRKSIIAPKKVRDGNREYFVEATDEEIFVFLQVARRYDLDPFIKEVVAFVSKRGAVVPYVTIDGWITLINRNKRFGGLRALPQYDSNGKLFAYTIIGRIKDKDLPVGYYEVEITESLKECKRSTGPWDEAESRMLRHKAVIQWGRYAFGYGGLHDQDDAEKIIEREAIDVTPGTAGALPPASGNLMPKALETVPPPPAAAAQKPARTEAPPTPAPAKVTPPAVATPAPEKSVGQAVEEQMREPGADEDQDVQPPDDEPPPAAEKPKIADRKKADAMTDDEKRAEIIQNAIEFAASDDPGQIHAAVEGFSKFQADGNDYKQGDAKKLKGKWLNTTLGRSRKALQEQGAA